MSTELRPGLKVIPVPQWQNKHQNFIQQFPKSISYRLTNPLRNKHSLHRYNATTENIKFLIKDAIKKKAELRAIGRGWSFTKVAYGKNGFVDTMALRLALRLTNAYLHDDFKAAGHVPDDVWFVQCGNSVKAINAILEKRRSEQRSIIASGASNGQTIAGATQTGTHGGAFDTGAVHDAIAGLHIVTGPDRHVFIEKKSDRIVNDTFIRTFNITEHIVDDDIFNAAVVGIGSFGIIHGVMLKTVPIFLLEKYRTRTEWTPQIKTALNTLDFDKFNLSPPQDPASSRMYHFQVIINPYNIGNGEKGVYLNYMYKIPYRTDYPVRTLSDRGYTYGDDTLGIVAGLLQNLPIFQRAAIKLTVNQLINLQYPNGQQFPWIGTMGETFNYTSLRGKTGSCALGIDRAHVSKSVDAILDIINNELPFAGVIALRYVKGTDALLGFTRFPNTCVLELDGADNKNSRDFFNKVCERLNNMGVKFTMHWGKLNEYIQTHPLSNFYDQPSIDKWKAARKKVFNNSKAMTVFENQFIRNCGLAG